MKPWKVLESHPLYKNIRIDRCELPYANVYDVPIFESMDWVTVVALTKDRQVVLERQYRHGMEKMILELPAGMMEPGESDPRETVRRELLEETGYSGKEFIHVGSVSPNAANHNNFSHAFLAMDVEKAGDQDLDPTEEIEVVLKPFDEVIALARRGELPQAMQISALFFALAYLGKIG